MTVRVIRRPGGGECTPTVVIGEEPHVIRAVELAKRNHLTSPLF